MNEKSPELEYAPSSLVPATEERCGNVYRKIITLPSAWYCTMDCETSCDVLDTHGETSVCFTDLFPKESLPISNEFSACGPKGRWRITVEFEPEEEK